MKNKWSGGWATSWFYCWIPLHKSEARGKGVNLLYSEMNDLDYLTEAPHSCASDDVNAMAFEETTKIIGGHDAVEEYLACGIVPLSNNWILKIERAEVLLWKVIFPLSKVAAMIGEQETNATFEMRIVSVANHLVRNYGPAEHELVWINFAMAALIVFLN
jgi:hypothetical protein